MKKLAMIVVLAISGFALSSEFTPASASKMNGKCLPVIRWRALQSTPDGDAQGGNAPYLQRLCGGVHAPSHPRGQSIPHVRAAQAQCLQTGVYIGPYSGWQFTGMQKMYGELTRFLLICPSG